MLTHAANRLPERLIVGHFGDRAQASQNTVRGVALLPEVTDLVEHLGQLLSGFVTFPFSEARGGKTGGKRRNGVRGINAGQVGCHAADDSLGIGREPFDRYGHLSNAVQRFLASTDGDIDFVPHIQCWRCLIGRRIRR